MKTMMIRSKTGIQWRQPRRLYSHEIPKSVRLTLLSYAEENELYAISLLSQELGIPVDLVGRYCRLLGIRVFYSWCEDEKCICGFRG